MQGVIQVEFATDGPRFDYWCDETVEVGTKVVVPGAYYDTGLTLPSKAPEVTDTRVARVVSLTSTFSGEVNKVIRLANPAAAVG